MLGWLKKQKTEVLSPADVERQQKQLADENLIASIERRYPPSVLWRTSPRWREANPHPIFIEDLDQWEVLIKHFPEPPRTSQERDEREQKFWWNFMNVFVRTDDNGSFDLAPRGEIQEYFELREHWIFRHYYAATGDIIQTYLREFSKLFFTANDEFKNAVREEHAESIAYEKYYKISRSFLAEPRFVDRSEQKYKEQKHEAKAAFSEIKRAHEQLESFKMHSIPAHMEKWGAWFFTGVQNAFRREYATKPPTENVYGDGGYASLDDIKKSERRNRPGQSAQTQEFD